MLTRTASIFAAVVASVAVVACSGADVQLVSGGSGDDSRSSGASGGAGPSESAGSSGASASADGGASSSGDGGQVGVDGGKQPPWVGPACARSKPNMANVRYQPAKRQKVCTASQVAQINDKLARGVPYRSIESDVKAAAPTCAACVFTNLTDATWGPLVYTSATGPAFRNFAGCWESRGKTQACARAYATADYCWRGVCDQCTTDPELTECVGRASSESNAPCVGETTDADVKCGGLASVAGCQNVFEVVASMCGE
ncbi:MAG: hypothetical protein JNL38_31835 [Myxococcales bacterium]|nr:hypothetical protein [Myxococcales bacterium]